MKKLVILASAALTLVLITMPSISLARVISFQAVLEDSTGGTQQATVPMVFKIYDSASKSATEGEVLIWTEAHPGVGVAANGTFTVELGGSLPFPDDLFETEVWLEIVVNGQTISPRTRLASSPSAFTSNRITGDFRSYQGGLILPDPLDSNRFVDISWQGIFVPLDTFYYSIPSSGGWVPRTNGTTYSILWSGGTMTATGLAGTDSAAFFAEVHLPDDVKVIELRAYLLDGDASRNFSFTFGYRGGTVSTEIATLSSSGSSAAWGDIAMSLDHTIQNSPPRAYYIRAVARGSAYNWGNVTLMCTRNKL